MLRLAITRKLMARGAGLAFCLLAILSYQITSVYALSSEQKRVINSGALYFNVDPTEACRPGSVSSSNNSVYLIGDSWLVRMMNSSPSLQETLQNRGLTLLGANGVVGRSINGRGQGDASTQPQNALEGIDADITQVNSAGKIVVILGTNSDNYDSSIPDLMEKLSGSKAQKYWVNTSANASSVAGSASSANSAIQSHSANEGYQVIDWFSVAFPGGNPTSIDSSATSPYMDSDKIHTNSEGTAALINLIATSVSQGAAPLSAGSGADVSSRSSLPQIALDRIAPFEARVSENRAVYESLAAKHNLPWQIFATIHIREAGADPTRSMLGGEPLGTKAVDSDNTPQTLEESGDLAAGYFKDLASAVYDLDITATSSSDDLKHAFLAYNRGFLYKRVNWTPEMSPYVMNLYDENYLGPDGDGMMFPSGAGETVSGKNSVPGAMTILAYFGLTPPGGQYGGCGSADTLNPGSLTWPVITAGQPTGRVTSCWSDLRTKTVSGGSYYHSGVDIAAGQGTDVVSVQAGRVVFADIHATYGNLVVIEHSGGLWSHYGHLYSIESGIDVGTTVSAGQKIGTVGNTGVSLGDHLHLNLYDSWPHGPMPEGAANSNGQETINALTHGLGIPAGIPDEAGCANYPNGGRAVNIEL